MVPAASFKQAINKVLRDKFIQQGILPKADGSPGATPSPTQMSATTKVTWIWSSAWIVVVPACPEGCPPHSSASGAGTVSKETEVSGSATKAKGIGCQGG